MLWPTGPDTSRRLHYAYRPEVGRRWERQSLARSHRVGPARDVRVRANIRSGTCSGAYECRPHGITGPGKISAEILTNNGIRISHNNIIVIHHSPYIVDSRSDPISVGCTIFRVARRYFRVFFSYGASQAKSERRARWTACKDAAGRQTRRATSDHVAHYRRGVFRSLSVPNVFYSDVLLCLRNSRNNGLKCMRFTAI